MLSGRSRFGRFRAFDTLVTPWDLLRSEQASSKVGRMWPASWRWRKVKNRQQFVRQNGRTETVISQPLRHPAIFTRQHEKLVRRF
jgi:hypothetical protein